MQTEFRQFIRYFLLLTTLLPIVLINGCQNGDPVGLRDVVEGSNNLITGEFVDVVTETIGASGGTIKVDNPADPMNGFEISVPPNSFTEAHTFEVSRAEIKSHNLGPYFNPVSPLIRISNQGGYAEDVIEVKVPIKIPKDHFAMGFFYDNRTGQLEGLPLLALDSTSVTIGTRHFTTSNLSGGSSRSLLKGNALPNFSDLVISAIDLSVLQGEDVIETGYKLREDNWEFDNPGSYISPGGMCAGMSISSMWYYYERRLHKADPLYSLFDQVDKILVDNPRGMRFAATIQKDYQTGPLRKLFNNIRDNPDYDYLGWHAFALSMLTTREPQYVSIARDGGAHALVAYRISLSTGTLAVADPNWPDQDRTIKYANKHFLPYTSKENVNDLNNKIYDHIGYCSKTSMIEWGKIGERWSEFEGGTIGNDRFPQSTLWVCNEAAEIELGDAFATEVDSLVFAARSPNCGYKYPNSSNAIEHRVYDENGNLLASTIANINNKKAPEDWKSIVKLKSGLNRLGFEILGGVDATSDDRYWIDFRWVNVTCQQLEIQSAQQDGVPILKPGEPNKEYKFIARTYGTAPAKAKFIWNFGDGSPEVSVVNDSTVQHTYSVTGSFTIFVSLYDNSTNKLVSTAKVTAKIGTNSLDLLQKCKSVFVSFRGLGNFEWNDGAKSQGEIDNFFSNQDYTANIYKDAPAISWSGSSFTVEYSRTYASPYFPSDVYACKLTISGNISADGKSITSLSAVEDRTLQKDTRDKVHRKVEIKGLPLTAQSLPGATIDFIYNAEGDEVRQYISAYEYVFAIVQESGTVVKTQTCTSLDWSTPLSGSPRDVSISFSEQK